MTGIAPRALDARSAAPRALSGDGTELLEQIEEVVTRLNPLAIDLYCGLGGWTDGLLAEGWDVIGVDIEEHVYGEHRYPGWLLIQDVLTLHGSQFKGVDLIVGSSPCQEFSYRAMPWKRAKALGPPELGIKLFEAQFRTQREACEAAGRHIPLVVENVRGAQKWVGRARWNFGSFYLWGDVPALMPLLSVRKIGGQNWNRFRESGEVSPHWNVSAIKDDSGRKMIGPSWDAANGCGTHGMKRWSSLPDGIKQPGISGTRNNGKGDRWFQDGAARHGSKSNARKAASAMIAKIPLPLARHIGATFYPTKGA